MALADSQSVVAASDLGFELGDRLDTLIGGELRQAVSGRVLEARDPSSGALLAHVPRCDAEDVEAAVRAGEAALPEWRAMHPLERAKLVRQLADALEADGDRLGLIDTLDGGSPLHVMRADVDVAVAALRYFAGLALELRGQTIPAGHDAVNYTIRQPYGLVARLVAFNHPLMFTVFKLAAPLVAGNVTMVKPSEHSSLSAVAICRHLQEIFPPGVVSIITGLGAEAGDALVAHPAIPRLSFVGGVATGMAIQARAASVAVKTITLELGGKNPLVILPDADLNEAVDAAIRGMNFTWQGQSCGSTSRLLVHSSIHAEFVEALAARVGAMRAGPPVEPSSDLGALINAAQLDKVLRYIEIGRGEGARLVAGGGRLLDDGLDAGFFVAPTIFDGVDPGGRLAQEEIFGPVLAVMPFGSYEEAVTIANGVSLGLTASVFTRDLGVAHAFARDVEAGYVWVNEVSKHIPGTPFGGVKNSGTGREEDLSELESFTQIKNVHIRLPTVGMGPTEPLRTQT